MESAPDLCRSHRLWRERPGRWSSRVRSHGLLGTKRLVIHDARCRRAADLRSEEHTSELQSQFHLVCRLLLEKKKNCHRSLFFFIDTATTEIYTLSLHDALPISRPSGHEAACYS